MSTRDCIRDRCHIYSLYWVAIQQVPEPPDDFCNLNYAILELPTADVPVADDGNLSVDRTILGTCDLIEQIQSTLFSFTDEGGNSLGAVQIIATPSKGYLTLGTERVENGDVLIAPEDFTTGLYYNSDDTTNTAYTDTILFRVQILETGLWSDIGQIDVSVTLCTNAGPVATDNTVPVDRTTTPSCLVTEEYTDGSIFTFTDADNDPLEAVKIMSLPTYGYLRYGQFSNVHVGDIIDFTESLYYITTSVVETAYEDYVSFQVLTEHSGTFSNTATVTFDISECTNINELPVATDNTTTVDRLTTETCALNVEYTEDVFTYTDTEGDTLLAVEIISAPTTGTLTLNGNLLIDGDILTIENGFPFYYNSNATEQASYTDTVQFRVLVANSTEYSNIATWTIEVSECTTTYTPCVTYEPHFDFTEGGIGLLTAGILISDTATIGEYVIEWRLGSVTGDLVLVSGSTNAVDATDNDVQVYHSPSNFPVPLAAGTYYPVLRWVEIDGIVYHSNPSLGDRFGTDLIECVDIIEVLEPIVVENLTCLNGTTSSDPDYDHEISYNNSSDPPQNASSSLTYYLNEDDSTAFIAWSFTGIYVSDTIKFTYVSGTNKTVLETVVVGTDVPTNVWNPGYAEVDTITFESVTDLRGHSYAIGDYVLIEITPSTYQPSNRNTNWRVKLKCLEDIFTCNYMDDNWRTIDPCTISGTFSTSACRLDVTFNTLATFPTSYERTYLNPSSSVSDGYAPSAFGNAGLIRAEFNTDTIFRYSSTYGSCTDIADSITYTKSGNSLLITFEAESRYLAWKNRYNTVISELDAKGYVNDPTVKEYYMFVLQYAISGISCGDSLSYPDLSFHRSVPVTFDDTNFIVTITQDTPITNQLVNLPCDDTYEEVNAQLSNMNEIYDRADGWTLTTNIVYSNYMAGRYPSSTYNQETVETTAVTAQFPVWNIDKVCGTPSWAHGISTVGPTYPTYEFFKYNVRLVITDATDATTIPNNFEVWDMMVDYQPSSDPADWTLLYKIENGIVTTPSCP